MKRFINPLLRLGTAVALLSVIYFQNKELKELRDETLNELAPDPEDEKKLNKALLELSNQRKRKLH